MTIDLDALFSSIQELVLRHSPSGVEQEVDALLQARFRSLGLAPEVDAGGNLFVKIPGQGAGSLVITAHKDEIGAVVTHVAADGRLKLQKLGGSYPWVYGEGVVDVLGDQAVVSGILSFGSRHVSHLSPQHALNNDAPVRWQDAWVETLLSPDELVMAGVRPGSRMVVGRHRKAPLRIKDHIASYTLDNKASLAILLALAAQLKAPPMDVYLLASAREEVGAIGAQFFAQCVRPDAMIALEICPVAKEYPIKLSPSPVLLSDDSFGTYDGELNAHLRRAAAACDIVLQEAVLSAFGSDGSVAMKAGHVPRAACLSFPTENTHGFEIADLHAIANCAAVLAAACAESLPGFAA